MASKKKYEKGRFWGTETNLQIQHRIDETMRRRSEGGDMLGVTGRDRPRELREQARLARKR